MRLRKKKAGASSAICRYTESSVLVLRIVRCCLKGFVGEALKIKYPTALEAVAANDYLYKSVKKSNCYINHCGAYGKRSIVPIEWFGEGVSGSFEGIAVSLPKEYELYLKRIYGDYMQLPPEEKRISHHYTEIIDTDKPYTAYIG